MLVDSVFGGVCPFCDRYHRRANRIDSDGGDGGDDGGGNIYMKMRYVMCRIGCDPSEIEIDEAVELAELYYEERVQGVCPLVEIT